MPSSILLHSPVVVPCTTSVEAGCMVMWSLIVTPKNCRCLFNITRMHAHRLALDKAATPATSGFGQPSIPRAAANVGALLADLEDAGRSLLQVNTDDFNCVGCPSGGPDTRTAVASTTSFPYSAIGQLMGQVTSNMCVLSQAFNLDPSMSAVVEAECMHIRTAIDSVATLPVLASSCTCQHSLPFPLLSSNLSQVASQAAALASFCQWTVLHP